MRSYACCRSWTLQQRPSSDEAAERPAAPSELRRPFGRERVGDGRQSDVDELQHRRRLRSMPRSVVPKGTPRTVPARPVSSAVLTTRRPTPATRSAAVSRTGDLRVRHRFGGMNGRCPAKAVKTTAAGSHFSDAHGGVEDALDELGRTGRRCRRRGRCHDPPRLPSGSAAVRHRPEDDHDATTWPSSPRSRRRRKLRSTAAQTRTPSAACRIHAARATTGPRARRAPALFTGREQRPEMTRPGGLASSLAVLRHRTVGGSGHVPFAWVQPQVKPAPADSASVASAASREKARAFILPPPQRVSSRCRGLRYRASTSDPLRSLLRGAPGVRSTSPESDVDRGVTPCPATELVVWAAGDRSREPFDASCQSLRRPGHPSNGRSCTVACILVGVTRTVNRRI